MDKISRKTTKALYDKLKPDVDYDQFHMGINVEMEHSDVTNGNLAMTAKIALAHLKEKSNYYSLLKKHVEKPTKNEMNEVYIGRNIVTQEQFDKVIDDFTKEAEEQIAKLKASVKKATSYKKHYAKLDKLGELIAWGRGKGKNQDFIDAWLKQVNAFQKELRDAGIIDKHVELTMI